MVRMRMAITFTTSYLESKDDLLAIATTDRNGDASFMTFTEAPGSTYDYEAGSVVKRTDNPFDSPDNLHKPQADGDATAQDNSSTSGMIPKIRQAPLRIQKQAMPLYIIRIHPIRTVSKA